MQSCTAEREDHASTTSRQDVDAEALRKDVHLGLQICRANSLSLTRLQLALNKGDRQTVLEAVDRLHDLDSRIGRLLKRLPSSANDDPEVRAFTKLVDEQSLAVAFEKLALVSEVSGPDMVTPSRMWDNSVEDHALADDESGADPDNASIAMRSPLYPKVLGLVLAFTIFAVLAAAMMWSLF